MIHSKVSGNGLPIVFIHGYGEDHTIWNGIETPITANYQYISLDLPGFGQSDPLNEGFSLDQIAESVRDHLVNKLNLSKIIIFGHSLGGYIALALAEKYPELIMGFGLINSTSLADSPEKKATRIKTAEFIKKHGARFFMNSFVPNLFAEERQQSLESSIKAVLRMGNNITELTLVRYMDAMRNRPNRSYLLEKYNYVLFVGGAVDTHFLQSDYDLQIALLKRKDFGIILPEVAHMSMFEAPSHLINTILHFVKSIKND